MKKAGIMAAGLALAGSMVVATPTFGATPKDGCTELQQKLNQLEVRFAHRKPGSKGSGRILTQIFTLRTEARLVHCKL